MMTVEQLGRCWFRRQEDSVGRAQVLATHLENLHLIERRTFEAHPLIRLARPLFTWNPGEPQPTREQFESLAETSRKRWKKMHVAIEVLIASKTAVRLFGAFSDARHARHNEITHDLHLTEVFIRSRKGNRPPEWEWWGESAFPKLGFEIKGMKDPDAFFMDGEGQCQCVIEFAGVYSAEHLAKFHAHCSGQAAAKIRRRFASVPASVLTQLYAPTGTAYELW